jgi:hypothetical protein
MKIAIRCLLLLALLAALHVFFGGGYPVRPLRAPLASAILSKEDFSNDPTDARITRKTVAITSPEELRALEASFLRVWIPVMPAAPSMEGLPRYTLTATMADGSVETFLFTRTEMNSGAPTPRRFLKRADALIALHKPYLAPEAMARRGEPSETIRGLVLDATRGTPGSGLLVSEIEAVLGPADEKRETPFLTRSMKRIYTLSGGRELQVEAREGIVMLAGIRNPGDTPGTLVWK